MALKKKKEDCYVIHTEKYFLDYSPSRYGVPSLIIVAMLENKYNY